MDAHVRMSGSGREVRAKKVQRVIVRAAQQEYVRLQHQKAGGPVWVFVQVGLVRKIGLTESGIELAMMHFRTNIFKNNFGRMLRAASTKDADAKQSEKKEKATAYLWVGGQFWPFESAWTTVPLAETGEPRSKRSMVSVRRPYCTRSSPR